MPASVLALSDRKVCSKSFARMLEYQTLETMEEGQDAY